MKKTFCFIILLCLSSMVYSQITIPALGEGPHQAYDKFVFSPEYKADPEFARGVDDYYLYSYSLYNGMISWGSMSTGNPNLPHGSTVESEENCIGCIKAGTYWGNERKRLLQTLPQTSYNRGIIKANDLGYSDAVRMYGAL